MTFNLDSLIFVSFLIINLAVGLYYARGVKTVREYAIGDRNFSTITISTTVIATCVGAGFFSASLTESYRQGLYYIIPALGEPIMLIIMGIFLVPRMVDFFGDLSVAETMCKFYGKNVGVITAITGILMSVGILALQFKVATTIMQLFFGVSGFNASLISAAVIVLYSALGGIKSVVFTDLFQFFTFGSIIPLISIIIWQNSQNSSELFFSYIMSDPLFSLKDVFDITNQRFIESLLLFCFFIMPSGSPVYVQRVSMSKNAAQAKKSFIISGLAILGMLLIICWISILLRLNNPNINPDNLLGYVIENYTFPGFKSLVAIGIMSIIMSTADSYINATSIMITNDILKETGLKNFGSIKNLLILRTTALIVGIGAFILSYKSNSVLSLIIQTMSFYMPVVTVPLLLAVFGIRSSSKVALTGMFFGGFFSLLWQLLGNSEMNTAILGMVANLAGFLIAHIILGYPRGYMSDEYKLSVAKIKTSHNKCKTKLFNFRKFSDIIDFSSHSMPKDHFYYVFVGLFSVILALSTAYLIKPQLQFKFNYILNLNYYAILLCSSILISSPYLSQFFKKSHILYRIKTLSIFYILCFAPYQFFIIGELGQIHILLFLVSMMILTHLVKWQLAMIMLIFSNCVSIILYKSSSNLITYKFMIIYTSLIIGAVFIAFLKPKQEQQELTEEKNAHLSDRIEYQESEVKRALNLKNEFINNVTHEYHAPMTGVISVAESLWEGYDNLSDKMRREAAETIYRSAIKLEHFDSNINLLSKLSNSHVTMNKTTVNLSRLIEERTAKCIKLYIDEDQKDQRNFKLEIAPNINLKCDEYYITKTIDNLILNSISYCKAGEIKIGLEKKEGNIEFVIEDEGIGIPPDEIFEIFGAFTVSSKTYSKAGGRGIGLTLCKMIVELHGGKIVAQSDGIKGAIFKFILPTQE